MAIPDAFETEYFLKLVTNLATSCHGSQELNEIKSFLAKKIKKTAQRESFLLPRLMQPAILWNDIKDRVWRDEKSKGENQYQFLQGDVVNTTMVLALGIAETSQVHDLWLVLSPDCDCVRAPYVCVAPLFGVYADERSSNTDSQRFGYAIQLSTNKAFPIPILPGDLEPKMRGYFADLEVPYFLRSEDKGFATPIASMTIIGWHLLNGHIQDRETRAVNIAEAEAIRGSDRKSVV